MAGEEAATQGKNVVQIIKKVLTEFYIIKRNKLLKLKKLKK